MIIGHLRRTGTKRTSGNKAIRMNLSMATRLLPVAAAGVLSNHLPSRCDSIAPGHESF